MISRFLLERSNDSNLFKYVSKIVYEQYDEQANVIYVKAIITGYQNIVVYLRREMFKIARDQFMNTANFC